MPFFEVVAIKMTAALQLQNCSRRLAQCIQGRQKPSWRWGDVTCSQGYLTYAHHGTGNQLAISLG